MSESLNLYKKIPARTEVILRDDDRIAGYNHDTMLTGDPDALVRPADAQECQEIIQYCNAHKLPITICASRTSMTGSSVAANGGLLLSIEKMGGVRDIGNWQGRPTAVVGPGMLLGDFQRTVHDAGWFYPPSPTSRNEAMIGATIATNATGDTTYKYGTTRKYIRELKLLLADGSEKIVTRPENEKVTELKNTAGYFLNGSEIDYFIGSEGTLGLITEIKVDLLSQQHPIFALFAFFPSNNSALECISHVHRDARLRPCALEFIDGNALKVMATHKSFPDLPSGAGAAILISQEYAEEAYEPLLGLWFETLEAAAPEMSKLLEHAIISTQAGDEERLRDWRHHIPAHVNEEGHKLERDGGGKVGSDWWTPIENMPNMMNFMYERSEKLQIPYLAFGHLGNGHPHINYLTRNADEKARARQLVHECCHHAVSLGGGVAGEHGLGKLKHELLAIQHNSTTIEQMYKLKETYDPFYILGRGNILKPR